MSGLRAALTVGKGATAARFVLAALAACAFYSIPREYLGERFPLCVFRALTGHECPGCGTTRGIWCILHGRFDGAYAYNPRVFATFPLLALCVSEWVFRYKHALVAFARDAVPYRIGRRLTTGRLDG